MVVHSPDRPDWARNLINREKLGLRQLPPHIHSFGAFFFFFFFAQTLIFAEIPLCQPVVLSEVSISHPLLSVHVGAAPGSRHV